RHARRVPFVVKIAPDLETEQINVIADVLCRMGVDGVIATNTTLAREAVAHLPYGNEAGGLSGRPVHEKSLRVIERLRSQAGTALAIIGVGGIFSANDARAKIQAGADAVQLYSGLIYQGPALVRECARALA